MAKRKFAALEAERKANAESGPETFISESDILGPKKRVKADYAERMASVAKGREGREKFGSAKGKKKRDLPSSTTNREKKRNKPIMMVMGSNAVRSKKKASLRDKQRKLRAHVRWESRNWLHYSHTFSRRLIKPRSREVLSKSATQMLPACIREAIAYPDAK